MFESQAISKYLVSTVTPLNHRLVLTTIRKVMRYGRPAGSTLIPRSSDVLNYSKYEQAICIEAYSTHTQVASLAFEKKYALQV